MKKDSFYKLTAILIIILAMFTACSSGTPERTEHTTNGYKIHKMFEYDGCTVYNVYAHRRTIYWTKCVGSKDVTTAWRSGKTNTTVSTSMVEK